MNKIRTCKAANFNRVVVLLVALTICVTIVPGFKTEARANDAAAFFGGMLANHIIGGAIRRDKIRTAATVEAASQPRSQTVYVQQPAVTTSAQSTQMTPEQKLQQLDKLAAGGYITPEEYKARKKAILDAM